MRASNYSNLWKGYVSVKISNNQFQLVLIIAVESQSTNTYLVHFLGFRSNVSIFENFWVSTIWIFSTQLPYIKKWSPINERHNQIQVKFRECFCSQIRWLCWNSNSVLRILKAVLSYLFCHVRHPTLLLPNKLKFESKRIVKSLPPTQII